MSNNLEPEQEHLLRELVEARRNVPRDRRERFEFIRARTFQGERGVIGHGGLPAGSLDVQPLDVDELIEAGLLRVWDRSGDSMRLDVTQQGLRYYEESMTRQREPVLRVQENVRNSLLSEDFRKRHPEAYDRWARAEAMLWRAESPEELSSIGLACREALILFTDSLIEKLKPVGVTTDKAKTKDRLRAVFSTAKPGMGEKESAWLESLLGYWHGVSGLDQRVTHAAEKEGEPIVWNDARRAVFQTMNVLYEVDDLLQL